MYEDFLNKRMYSMLRTDAPDREQFHMFYKAKKIEVVLKPGNFLFIPKGWFHMVFSETDESMMNIAVGFWSHTGFSEDLQGDFVSDISRIDHIDHEIHMGMVQRSEPYTGPHAIHQSDPFFTIANLSKYLDNQKVMTSPTRLIPTNAIKSYDYEIKNMTLDEYIRINGKNSYFMVDDIKELNAFKPKWLKSCDECVSHLWVNMGGVNTLLHYDGYDNVLCQVQGTKRIVLFAPSDREYLYLYNPFSSKTIEAYAGHHCLQKTIGLYIFEFKYYEDVWNDMASIYVNKYLQTHDIIKHNNELCLFESTCIIIPRNDTYTITYTEVYNHSPSCFYLPKLKCVVFPSNSSCKVNATYYDQDVNILENTCLIYPDDAYHSMVIHNTSSDDAIQIYIGFYGTEIYLNNHLC